MNTTVAQQLTRSNEMYRRLAELLAAGCPDDSARSILADSMGRIALEHGISLVALVALESLSSATALLRVQFEFVTRAIWLQYCASDDWIDKVGDLVSADSFREPANSRTMTEMLIDIEATGPPHAGQMLSDLKRGAWAPLNSYVHGGIHPLMRLHRGFSPEFAINTLLNANGLTIVAGMLLAVLTGDSRVTKRLQEMQLEYRDCLPPLWSKVPPPTRA